jgi:polysaccharide export outer membrane protein
MLGGQTLHRGSRLPGRPVAGRRRSVLVAGLALAASTIAALLLGTTVHAQGKSLAGAAESAPEYTIEAGDVLQVFVWKEPELSRDVSVRLDGKITVPLIGDIQASGRTPSQLAGEVEAALKRYISSPQVTLGVLETKNALFYVLGEVTRPGAYPLTGRVTVLQGLALAGGFREFAKTDNIVVIRQRRDGEQIQAVNYDELKNGRNLDQNVVLRPGDTIVVR